MGRVSLRVAHPSEVPSGMADIVLTCSSPVWERQNVPNSAGLIVLAKNVSSMSRTVVPRIFLVGGIPHGSVVSISPPSRVLTAGEEATFDILVSQADDAQIGGFVFEVVA